MHILKTFGDDCIVGRLVFVTASRLPHPPALPYDWLSPNINYTLGSGLGELGAT